MPVELAEQCRAGVLQQDVVGGGEIVQHRRVAGERGGRGAARRAHRHIAGIEGEAAGRGAVAFHALGVQALVEAENADDEVITLARIVIADFLGVLVLMGRVVGIGRDRQAGIVAVVSRAPIPVAPGGDRGQRAAAHLPFGQDRGAAQLVAGLERGIQIGDAVEGIGAGNAIIERGGQGVELAVQRPLGRADAGIIQGAAGGVLQAVIGREGDLQVRRGVPLQLAAQAQIVLAVDEARRGDVVDRAAARGVRER